uniref:Hexosyltransferase n=1 Tax=Mola mola TaxID=94237 RepID=A0A3Q3WQC4_MOLML
QKKSVFVSCFLLLLVLTLALLIICYTLSSSSLSWPEKYSLYERQQRFFNQLNLSILHPLFHEHPKQITLNKTTQSPTTPPTVPPTGVEYHQAYPRNYHFIMDHTEACKHKTPFLVLMVPVAPHNVEARDAIRQTWGNKNVVQGEVVLTFFMLGSSGSDFLDTYLNLTIKTMVIMEWLATHCPTAAYAMKVDSDMFLNIDNLVIMLKKPDIPKQNYLTGLLMWNRPVVRSKDSKWYVPEEMYPETTYPPYTLGMGYVFSNDLPEKFVEASKTIKPFNIEDAYIGMCMKKLELSLSSPPDPSQFKSYNWGYSRCEFSKVITYILGSSEELVKYWTDLKKPEPPC